MQAMRLCSVYEVPPETLTRSAGYDAVGGMQVHTSRLTEALDARGVYQVVITSYRPGAPRVQQLSVRSRVVRVGFPVRRLRQLYGVAAFPEVARSGRPNVVHVHLGEDLAIMPLARWAAWRAGAPLVATVHCSLRHTLIEHDARSTVLRTIGGPMQSRLLRSADAVLVLSERLADRLVASGVQRSRVRVVPLGIEIDPDRPLPRPPPMHGRSWVVYAGRLVREKGVRDLVAAFGTVAASDVGLLIVGDGPDRGALESYAHSLARSEHVRFVGAVPHDEVRAFLRHAAVVVTPSWFEERGRVLLEAMALGRPVVATRAGGIPATVRDGVNGLLVPPKDPVRLAAAIKHVLADETRATSMGAAGRAAASGHGMGALADATLATYEAVLGRLPKQGPLRLVEAP